MSETIIEIYEKLKRGEDTDTGKFSPEFIMDCFKYGWLKVKPSKAHIKWFEDAFETTYPVYLSDISKELRQELKGYIKERKDTEKREEKWKMQRYKRGYSDADCWDIYGWFLNIMPKMLQQMRDNLHGYPADLPAHSTNQIVSNSVIDNAEEEPGFKEWKEILDRMIFLLKEMDEEKCSYKNPYEKDFFKMNENFRKKYGFFGEGLKSEEEKEEEKKKHLSRMYFPGDFPELYPEAKELSNNFMKHETYKNTYMNQCREEFFNLFSKYFYSLWD